MPLATFTKLNSIARVTDRRYSSEVIIRAPVIITMHGAPIIDGAVRISGDRIVQVGKTSQVTARSDRTKMIDLNGHVLLPGLVNPHCHLDYTGLRGKIPTQKSFTDWIRAINAEKAKLSEADYIESIAEGGREALRFGTTSMVNLEAFPELIERCAVAPLRVWWCAELIDVNAREKADGIVATAMNFLRGNHSAGRFGFAPHALYTASAELYRECERIASSGNLLLCTHLAESREEMEMFRDRAGPLFQFLQSFGRDFSDCDGATPLTRFLEILGNFSAGRHAISVEEAESFPSNSATGHRWIVAHLNELTDSDFDLLKKLPLKFSIAHCPRSHDYFCHTPFPFEKLRALGFNICLATDSLASNTDLSLFAEMREFQKSHNAICPDEIVQMITANAANALGRAADLGRIAPGYLADMIAVPLNGSTNVYEQIIAFAGDVPWVMIGGKVV